MHQIIHIFCQFLIDYYLTFFLIFVVLKSFGANTGRTRWKNMAFSIRRTIMFGTTVSFVFLILFKAFVSFVGTVRAIYRKNNKSQCEMLLSKRKKATQPLILLYIPFIPLQTLSSAMQVTLSLQRYWLFSNVQS